MYVIKNTDYGAFFSLLGSPHFTNNMDIMQPFNSERDAELCIEQFIDSDKGFDMFYNVDVKIVEMS